MNVEEHQDERREPARTADLIVVGEARSTVFLVRPQTESGHAWIQENVSSGGYQPWWPEVIVEHRYLPDLVEGAQAAGLAVDWRPQWPGEGRNQHER